MNIIIRAFILLYNISIILTHPIHKQVMKSLENESTKNQFKKWHYIFNKPYDLNSEQAIIRYKIFKNNLLIIKEHNSKNLSWKLGLGIFTDLSKEEFTNLVTNKEKIKQVIPDTYHSESIENTDYIRKLKEIDWSYAFGNVKNQALLDGCKGTCYAYSSAALLEALVFLKYNVKIEISALELALCTDQENGGCNGGQVSKVLQYVVDNGVSLEKNYPSIYETTSDEKFICKKDQQVPEVKLKSSKACYFQPQCRYLLNKSIGEGPLIGGMDFTEYQHYESGIADYDCKTTNHSVVIVQVAEDYIKFRNNYGVEWGELGYGRVSRNSRNELRSCGLEIDINIAYGIEYLGK
jgi:KDEL-tailed cysteine endopeptidase